MKTRQGGCDSDAQHGHIPAIFYGRQRFAIKFTARDVAGEHRGRRRNSSQKRTGCHRRSCKRNTVSRTDAAAAAAAAVAAAAAAAAALTLVDWTMRFE